MIEAELTAYFQAAPAASCDLIASADTLVYFGDLEPITAAAARVLRPGGCFIFTVEKAPDPDRRNGILPLRAEMRQDAASTPKMNNPRGANQDEQGFFLQPHGRYCHTDDYVQSVIEKAGLKLHGITPCVLRMELGKPVNGMVVSASRTGI